jgi:hypothetical protein
MHPAQDFDREVRLLNPVAHAQHMEALGVHPLVSRQGLGRSLIAENLGLEAAYQLAHVQHMVIVAMGDEDVVAVLDLIRCDGRGHRVVQVRIGHQRLSVGQQDFEAGCTQPPHSPSHIPSFS